MRIKQKVQEIYQFLWNFCIFKSSCDLELRPSLPKLNQLLSVSQWYIHASLATFCALVQEISCIQEIVRLTQNNFFSLRTPVTLKMGSKSPNLNQPFGMSKWCIHASLVKFNPFSQEIWWMQTVTPTPMTEIRAETNMSPSLLVGGHNHCCSKISISFLNTELFLDYINPYVKNV